MSLLLALGTEDYVLISADRRAMSLDDRVATEDYQKVYIVNSNIILGFTGDIESCLDTIGFLKETDCSNYTLNSLSNELHQKARKTFDNRKKGFNVLLGGMSEDGKFEMNTFTTSSGLVLEKHIAKDDKDIKFLSLCNDTSIGKAFKILQNIFDGSMPDKDKAIEMLFDIHKQIAEIDNTVNTNIDFMYIDKKNGLSCIKRRK